MPSFWLCVREYGDRILFTYARLFDIGSVFVINGTIYLVPDLLILFSSLSVHLLKSQRQLTPHRRKVSLNPDSLPVSSEDVAYQRAYVRITRCERAHTCWLDVALTQLDLWDFEPLSNFGYHCDLYFNKPIVLVTDALT